MGANLVFRCVTKVIVAFVSIMTVASASAADLSATKPLPKSIPALASPWQFQFTPYHWMIFVTGDQQLNLNNYVGYRALSIDYQQGSGNRTIGLDLVIHGPVIGSSFKW